MTSIDLLSCTCYPPSVYHFFNFLILSSATIIRLCPVAALVIYLLGCRPLLPAFNLFSLFFECWPLLPAFKLFLYFGVLAFVTCTPFIISLRGRPLIPVLSFYSYTGQPLLLALLFLLILYFFLLFLLTSFSFSHQLTFIISC